MGEQLLNESGYYVAFNRVVGSYNHMITISTYDSGWQVVHSNTLLEQDVKGRGKPRKVGSVQNNVYYWATLKDSVSCVLGIVIKLNAKADGLGDILSCIDSSTMMIVNTINELGEKNAAKS